MTDKTEFLEGLYVQHIEGYSPPDGYWLTADVMRYVLGIWWGQRSQLEETTIWGHIASYGHQSAHQKHTPLVAAEQIAQHREAQNVVWQGLADGAIESKFQSADGRKKSIPKDAWAVLPKQRQRDFLGLGYPWGYGSEAPELGENKRPFIFERESCAQWLRTIRSPHTLPNPLKRDASLLRDDTYISLCEIVTWLANGVPKGATEFRADSVVGHDYLLDEIKRMEGEFDGRCSDEFGDFIAEHLAQDVRYNEVCKELEQAVSGGNIEAHGSFSGSAHRPLPKHIFAGGAEIIFRNDMIGAGDGTDVEDFRKVRENDEWSKVRLLTQQVKEAWGLHIQLPHLEKHPKNLIPRNDATDHRRKSPGATKKRDAAARAYNKLFPKGHDRAVHTWDNVCLIIKEQFNINISAKALKAGIADLGYPKP